MKHLLNISCSELNSSGQGRHTIRAYQLNPGVDADSNGIHWLHIVPPVSGDIQHLSRGDTKPSEPLMDQQFSGITIVFLSGSLCDKCWGSTKLSWSSTRWQQTPFLFCQQVIRSWSDPIFKWASLIDHSLLSFLFCIMFCKKTFLYLHILANIYTDLDICDEPQLIHQ